MTSVIATKVRIPSAPSMAVDRLDARLDAVWQHRLALIIAPAGSGKTTLLARFALRAPGPTGWYRAEGWDRDEAALLAHIEAALAPALEGVARGWRSVGEAAIALEAWRGEHALLVVDDLHTLQGTPAESALERLIAYAPPSLTFALASRVPPGFNLSRLRVAGELLELSGEDLRFRSWEVERLFNDFYAQPLPPEELARLARRTEGWAAGLQLFHLATHGRTADERHRLLAQPGSSARFTRDYLTRNVLHHLPGHLRRFLVDTSVLGRLSGDLCDQLLGRSGSSAVLSELEDRRLFTQPLPEPGHFRYHEVLRSCLHAILVEELSEEGLRERCRMAGDLLVEAGAIPEAFEAYCRAEDWDGVRALLASQGPAVADLAQPWVDALPATVLHDPWLLLASARRLRAEGRFRDALERYQRAADAFGATDAAPACRRERQALAIWIDNSEAAPQDGSAFLRSALNRAPGADVIQVAGSAAATSLMAGFAYLLGGRVSAARRELLHAAQRSEASSQEQIVAALGAGIAAVLMGQHQSIAEVESAVAAAETSGHEWLAQIGRAALALSGTPETLRDAEAVAAERHELGDGWGVALARLSIMWGGLAADSNPAARHAVRAAQPEKWEGLPIAAPVIDAWVAAIGAVYAARAGDADADERARQADILASDAACEGARLLAGVALAGSGSDARREELDDLVAAISRETGLRPPLPVAPSKLPVIATHAAPAGGPPISIRLFGAFEFAREGRVVDIGGVRPKARALLRLLGLHLGQPLHHETIESALWPEAAAESSARNLHVAIAALRRVIEPTASRGGFQLIRRAGDAYLFELPPGSSSDLEEFDRLVSRGRHARQQSDLEATLVAFNQALDVYAGDLLPEDGPAEWASRRRDGCRLMAVEAAQAVAEILIKRGDVQGAARASARGLGIEPYHDPLWRLLIEARQKAGDQVAATRAQLSYEQMLAEIGVDLSPASSSRI